MNQQEFDQLLAKYADVTVQIGLNLRKGQTLLIRGILEDAPFIRKVTESAYKAGARYVDVWWSDEKISRLFFEYANAETAAFVPEWILHRFEEYYKNGQANLAILSNDPNLFAGIDPDLLARSRKARAEKVNEPLRPYENDSNWCVVATATPSWAKTVFPDLPLEQAQSKLWEAIFNICRIDTPDPVAAWDAHIKKLIKYREYLNAKSYRGLHYKGPGTDLTVGLPTRQVWISAQETFKNGITCTVNIPTEEVFTAPHKDQVNGVVSSSRPLNLQGILIDDFSITFENGCAVKVTAKKGEADLQKLIETDENSARIGEVALVSNSSPISRSGHLFYNTLFDENAACHIALGNAFRNTIKGGEEMSEEEFAASGGNKSIIHVDFMIGSGQLDIDGICEDGTREPVMRQGDWAFDV
jgi:aminopeptidase